VIATSSGDLDIAGRRKWGNKKNAPKGLMGRNGRKGEGKLRVSCKRESAKRKKVC